MLLHCDRYQSTEYHALLRLSDTSYLVLGADGDESLHKPFHQRRGDGAANCDEGVHPTPGLDAGGTLTSYVHRMYTVPILGSELYHHMCWSVLHPSPTVKSARAADQQAREECCLSSNGQVMWAARDAI